MYLFKISAAICFLLLMTACFKREKAYLDSSVLKVSSGDLAFTVDKISIEPGKEVAFKLFNGLKDEKLSFYLLKKGEDPIVVQHIKVQQGSIPQEYFIFKSNEVEPNAELEVSFKAPKEEGVYSFVGIADRPRETMVGTLIVKKKSAQVENAEEDYVRN